MRCCLMMMQNSQMQFFFSSNSESLPFLSELGRSGGNGFLCIFRSRNRFSCIHSKSLHWSSCLSRKRAGASSPAPGSGRSKRLLPDIHNQTAHATPSLRPPPHQRQEAPSRTAENTWQLIRATGHMDDGGAFLGSSAPRTTTARRGKHVRADLTTLGN